MEGKLMPLERMLQAVPFDKMSEVQKAFEKASASNRTVIDRFEIHPLKKNIRITGYDNKGRSYSILV